MLIGSPDEVAEQLREVATSLNADHLMLLLRGILPEWEDRWWPQPIDAAE